MKALRLIQHHGGAPATSAPTNGARPNNGRWLASAHSDFSSHINQTKAARSVHRLSVSAALQAHFIQIAWALIDRVVWALGLATIAIWRGVVPGVRALLKTPARNHT